jgi:hypothetical protein
MKDIKVSKIKRPGRKLTFQEIEGSDKPIPSWLQQNVAGHKRTWGRTIINYPLEFIKASYESGNNPRLNPNIGYELIAQKIQRYGFIGSIPVTPIYFDNKYQMIIYEVISGDRRFLALKSLGYTHVNIEVYEGTEKEIAPLRMALNMDSEVPQAEQAIYIYNILIKRYNYTHDQISDICSQSSQNVGRTWVTLMATIGQNCTKPVIRAWSSGKIKKAHAVLISRYFTKHDINKQKRLLKFILKTGIKANYLKKKLEEASKNGSEINISDIKKGCIIKQSETDSIDLGLLVKKRPARIKNKRKKRVAAVTTFQLISRYESLKTKVSHTEEDEVRAALLNEYRWILQLSNGDRRCLLT